jgi:excinuclease UvrABC ATPase subunit
VTIPHGQWVTFCGRSGSGKTSLALETLYAEGQRRYIESFSAYTRQYLQVWDKPQAREITGIPPAIAVTRSSRGLTGRATVGSHTEVLDYLREVYAKLAIPFCDTCQQPVQRYSTDSMAAVLAEFPTEARAMIGFTWRGPRRCWTQVAAHLQANGFSRLSHPDLPDVGGGPAGWLADMAVREEPGTLENAELPLPLALESLGWSSVHNPRPQTPVVGGAAAPRVATRVAGFAQIESQALPKKKNSAKAARQKTSRRPISGSAVAEDAATLMTVDVIVDRVVLGQTSRARWVESLEAAVAVGGRAFVWVADPSAEHAESGGASPIAYRCGEQWGWRHHFSTSLECDGCNQVLPFATPALFSYNSPVGACPTCEGFGSVSQYDIRKIVPEHQV